MLMLLSLVIVISTVIFISQYSTLKIINHLYPLSFRRQGSCTFSDSFPNGYMTSCQQKYIYRKLLALGEDGKPVSDSFRLPSCCSCVVTKSFLTARMAGDMEKSQTRSRRRRRRRLEVLNGFREQQALKVLIITCKSKLYELRTNNTRKLQKTIVRC